MKKFIFITSLILGISGFATAQTASHLGNEKQSMFKGKVKVKKQVSHFAKQKPDKAIRHNGTAVRREQCANGRKVDGNGFASTKWFPADKKKKVRKVRNKTFNTYTMK
ncbi:MAG: hypothetical protein JWO09_1304 [Bacteroidetes bacterium]|nr:hypothetical protein [Bacteroidota bacterium]